MAMMVHVALEDRESDVPPSDALAECVVLSYVLYHAPAKAADCDLLPLLVFPEHRAIWRVMQRVYRADESPAHFYIRWLNEAEHERHGLSDVLIGLGASWSRWQHNQLARDLESYRSVSTMDFDWWLARLCQVAMARRLIDETQCAVGRLWRGDVDGAIGLLKESLRRASIDEPGMEIPVA